MSEKKKIVIPTSEEVTEYAAGAASGDTGGTQSGPDSTASAQAADASPGAPTAPSRSEADEYKDKYLRAVAELSNYRKRSEKDREESLRYANANLVRSLLNVLDNLDRVIASAQEHPENTAAIVDGVKLTADSFRKVLGEHHVTTIEAEGQVFDPVVHEAMMQQPSDRHEVPTVLSVVQPGYKLHDRVVRPARVIVSKPVE